MSVIITMITIGSLTWLQSLKEITCSNHIPRVNGAEIAASPLISLPGRFLLDRRREGDWRVVGFSQEDEKPLGAHFWFLIPFTNGSLESWTIILRNLMPELSQRSNMFQLSTTYLSSHSMSEQFSFDNLKSLICEGNWQAPLFGSWKPLKTTQQILHLKTRQSYDQIPVFCRGSQRFSLDPFLLLVCLKKHGLTRLKGQLAFFFGLGNQAAGTKSVI